MISIPSYNTKTNQWDYRHFQTKDELTTFVESILKPPGFFKIENSWAWRQEAIRFQENEDKFGKGFYSDAVFRSKDYVDYWDREKEKCRKGVIIDDKYFLSRYYYFYLNFLKINDKEINKLVFPRLWDSQYYFFLYHYLSQLKGKNVCLVKKRQWGFSFQHLAILINDIWFEEGFINKLGASDDEYINADWAILEEYRNFLNDNTAWYRQFTPDKTLFWQQRKEVRVQGKKQFIGNRSILKGLNLKISPVKGVGGKVNRFHYEEAGISKTMTKTHGYVEPALLSGATRTGYFLAGGSVGELEDCEDLKKFVRDPVRYDILPVKNIFSEEPEIEETAFFVPEYWSMPPFIDENGNSLIEEAKAYCMSERLRQKEKNSAEEYRLFISQHPFTMEEAFAWRKDSIFNQALILKQLERIAVEKRRPDVVKLDYTGTGVTFKLCDDCIPIDKYPLGEKDGREGAVIIWEHPPANPKWLTYFAGVDPISVDKTTTSTSLFCIYIVKNIVETTYNEDKDIKIKVDGYKPVACYIGRYDDLKKTNEIAEKLIVMYNALTAVENNVMSFINHMQARSLQRYLATKNDLSFVSELRTNTNVYCPYGFKMNDTIKQYFIDVIKEYISEEIDELKKKTGEKIRTIYGVERLWDAGLLEELRLYNDKLNVDRFVAFGAALALMKSFRKYDLGVTKVDETKKVEDKIDKVDYMGRQIFKHVGKVLYPEYTEKPESPAKSFFKNVK